jgi:hypothetical protein
MTVKAIKIFMDTKEGRIRKIGEVFDVTAKRAGEINAGPHGQLVEVIEQKKKEGK